MIYILKDELAAQKLVATLADRVKTVAQVKNRVAIVEKEDVLTADERIDVIDTVVGHHGAIRVSRELHPENTVITTAHSHIGEGVTIMAGPDAIESEAHLREIGTAVRDLGATILRGGSYKPRTSPYSFQGVGEAGLAIHRKVADELNMDMMTEVLDTRDVALVGQYTDIFQVGARNMQNFALLKALGQQAKPVLLKRGMSATLDEYLFAAEYIVAFGNPNIILMERGIRGFDAKYTRNVFDVAAVPVLQSMTHLPVLVDSSHAAGKAKFVEPLALAGIAAGAQGYMVELHNEPAKALVDGDQALTTVQFAQLVQQAQAIYDIVAR
ncbi:3-deoxy-7-phosphoheptulonate synthase [Weissella soli]|jgi:3-deoxy-7-phosphoheptulonate synthase|uniref:3-deoxy-7-phosphoheptulonate synthase n=1 Tax=Weissella soli TaxID=155866 RepID=UPI003C710548